LIDVLTTLLIDPKPNLTPIMIRFLTLIVATAALSLTSCQTMKKSGGDSCCATPAKHAKADSCCATPSKKH
jgi:hypothetical protein